MTILQVHSALIPPEISHRVLGLVAAGHDGLHLVEDLAHIGEDLLPGLDADTRQLHANS